MSKEYYDDKVQPLSNGYSYETGHGHPNDLENYNHVQEYNTGETTAIREEEVKNKSPLFRFLNKAFDNGVEARGIERVPEDERDGKHTIGLLLLWWSVNLVVSTVPIGVSRRFTYQTSSTPTPTQRLLLKTLVLAQSHHPSPYTCPSLLITAQAISIIHQLIHPTAISHTSLIQCPSLIAHYLNLTRIACSSHTPRYSFSVA
jgi:hypothetical protein